MDEASLLFVGRLAERLIVVLCGGLSLTFGWHLFKIGVINDQNAEFSRGGFRIHLRKVGPGVFFALFGAVLLGVSLYRPLIVSDAAVVSEDPNTMETRVSYFSKENERGMLQHVKALNSQIHIITDEGLKRLARPEGRADRNQLLETMVTIRHLRDHIVIQKFGKDALRIWHKHSDGFLRDPANAPQEHHDLLSNMKVWMKDTL